MRKKYVLFLTVIISLCCMLLFFLRFTETQKNKNVVVSVVIPTHNRATLLQRALDSILSQTFQDFEIIVVDDGSTDNTSDILDKYQKISQKIKVIRHSKNQGVSAARNTGNRHASGKYIAIIDSDDFARPNYLDTAVAFMEQHPTVTIGIPLKDAFHKKDDTLTQNIKTFPWNYPVYDFVQYNHIGNVGNIFRRDFIVKHHIKYKSTYSCGEDYDFWMQMILKGAQIARIESEKALVVFRAIGGLSRTGNCRFATMQITHELYKNIDYTFNKNEFDFCKALKKTITKYPSVLLPFEKENIKNICPNETEIYIKLHHPYWKDYLVFETPSVLKRKKTSNKATLISFFPKQELTLKWDEWGTETFIWNQNENAYIFIDKP